MQTLFNSLRHFAVGAVLAVTSAIGASATTIPTSFDLTISASVGNPVQSGTLPFSTTITSFGAGPEFSQSSNNLITFLSSGFPQTMTGTVSVDVTAGSIVLGYSGTAQGVGLTYSLTNIAFADPNMEVSGASETGSTGIIGGVNSTASVSSTANSISGGFSFFGFQPGTNTTQTISFTTAVVTPPPPPAVPLPASMPLLLAGLGGLAWLRRR